jgi:hypothetical protein
VTGELNVKSKIVADINGETPSSVLTTYVIAWETQAMLEQPMLKDTLRDIATLVDDAKSRTQT